MGESNNTNYTAVCSQSVGIDDLWKSRGLHSVRAFGHGSVYIDDLWKSRGLHSVRAFGHGPVYIGPCLRV